MVAWVKFGFSFNKVPCSLFGKSFSSKGATSGVFECFFLGDRFPVFLRVDVAWSIFIFIINDHSERAYYDLKT